MKKPTLYIQSNPEGLVSAPINSIFYRNGQKYYVINGKTVSYIIQLFSKI